MVEDRSFEGVQPRPRQRRAKPLAIHPAGRPQDDLHFHGKRLQGGITLDRAEENTSGGFSRAIKHSSTAQLLLPHTWSERGTVNLLESGFRKFCLLPEIKNSLSHWDSSIVRGVLLVFDQRSLHSSLKYVKLDLLGYYVKQNVLFLNIAVVYLYLFSKQ